MAIYEINREAIQKLDETTFASSAISERGDLQRLLQANIEIIVPGVMVIAEEFSEWEDSRRRIDLLGLDKNANLVVIELKRTEDGRHMELQALRYAAMVSAMTFSKVVSVHQRYLDSRGRTESAEAKILEFLSWDEPIEEDFAQDVRIILASADFSKEITSTVMWLNEHDIDVRCVRLKPYLFGDKVLLDVQQIIPLPEAADYQVQIREKAAEQRQSRREDGKELTRYDLKIGDNAFTNLSKRRLIYYVVQAAINNGVTPEELQSLMDGDQNWLVVDGECSGSEFHEKAEAVKAESGAVYQSDHYCSNDDDLFHINGKTYALRKSSRTAIATAEKIKSKYPELLIEIRESGLE